MGRLELTTLCALLVCFGSRAEAARGRVRQKYGYLNVLALDEETKLPVDEPVVYLEGGNYGTFSIAAGYFSSGAEVHGPTGRYRLGVSAIGYCPVEFGVCIWAGLTRTRTVYLRRAETATRVRYGHGASFYDPPEPDTSQCSFARVQVAGLITDGRTGLPVEGACVFAEGTTCGTATDRDGRFRFFVPAGRRRIVCARYWQYRQADTVLTLGASPEVSLSYRLRPFRVDMTGSPLQYGGSGGYVWLIPDRFATGDTLAWMAGQVFDRSTGLAIAGAEVYTADTSDVTGESFAGAYRLFLRPGRHRAVAECLMYQRESVEAVVDTSGMLHSFALVPLWDPDSMPARWMRLDPLPDSVPLFPAQDSNRWGYMDPDGRIVIEPQFLAAFPFSEGRAWVRDATRHPYLWGVIDRTGRYVTGPTYEGPGVFSEGLSPALVTPVFGFVDHAGREVVPCRFDLAFDFSEDLARVRVDSLFGWIDRAGDWAVRPRYLLAEDFHEGRAGVGGLGPDLRTKWGYIDRRGREVIPPKYLSARDFSCGHAAVQGDSGWTYVDRNGHARAAPPLAAAGDFSEGLAAVQVRGYGHQRCWGYVDTTGDFAIGPQFERAGSFICGLAAVLVHQDTGRSKWGFIDRRGRFVVEPEYDDVKEFSDGLAAVLRKGEGWKYVDTTGRTIYVLRVGYPGRYASGMVRFSGMHNTGFRDRTGRTAIAPRFSSARDFVGWYAPVQEERRAGWVDKTGNVILGPDFEQTRHFSEGLAPVARGRRWGFADTSAHVVIPCRYMEVSGFKDGRAMVKRGPKWGFIDTAGKMVIAPVFDSVGRFSEGRARVTDTLAPLLHYGSYLWIPIWGYIDKQGRIAVGPRYARATEFSAGLAAVAERRGGVAHFGFIDDRGNYVVPDTLAVTLPFSEGFAAVGVRERDSLGSEVALREGEFIPVPAELLRSPELDSLSWGFINQKGERTIESSYRRAQSFAEGLAAVEGSSREHYGWGFVDSSGRVAVKLRPGFWGWIPFHYREGVAALKWTPSYLVSHWGVSNPEPTACFIGRRGHLQVARVFEDVGEYQHGIAPVKWRGHWHYVDKSGRFVW